MPPALQWLPPYRAWRAQHATGSEIDGSRFEKNALVQWRHERLTFGEAMALLGVSKATLDRWAKQGKLAPLADMEGKQRWFARGDVERLREGLTCHDGRDGVV